MASLFKIKHLQKIWNLYLKSPVFAISGFALVSRCVGCVGKGCGYYATAGQVSKVEMGAVKSEIPPLQVLTSAPHCAESLISCWIRAK